MTARCTLADALIESIEGSFRMFQTTGSDVGSKNDAPVVTVMYAIPGLEHGTIARHRCVA